MEEQRVVPMDERNARRLSPTFPCAADDGLPSTCFPEGTGMTDWSDRIRRARRFVVADSLLVSSTGWRVLSAPAAAVGFGKTSKCRQARQAMFVRLQRANAQQRADEPPVDTLTQ